MPFTFTDLWDNHPSIQTPPERAPCKDAGGSPSFDNQCAIRLSACFTATGISLATFRGAFCWHGHGRNHILRVEEFGPWIHSQPRIFGTRERVRGTAATSTRFSGKTGIIMCRNFWGRGSQGDHIDLWNKTKLAQGDADYIDRSQDVWFWSIA